MTSHSRLLFSIGIVLVFLSACSTESIAPSISDFAKATKSAMAAGAKSFEDSDLDARIVTAERERMVRDGAGYAPADLDGGDCAPVFPSDLDPEIPRGFDEACPLQTFTLGPDGGLVPYERGLGPVSAQAAFDGTAGPDETLTYERNARTALKAMADYAEAIDALATAGEPQQVGKSLGAAVKAVKGLASAAATVQDDKGLSPKTAKIFKTAAPLAETLSREILEARRYALLSDIVRASDPLIQGLSEAAALWFYQLERDDLVAAYDTAANSAFATASPNRTVADIAAADAAVEAAREAEGKAKWRVFWSVAVAHHAILRSFDAPPDLERLADANARIQDLIEVTDNFVKAVEAAREE